MKYLLCVSQFLYSFCFVFRIFKECIPIVVIFCKICFVGFETARALALAGCTVIMACRNISAAKAAAKIITNERAANIHVMALDLASLKSVRQFAQEYIDKGWSVL